MNILNITCKKATFLITKKEHNAINIWEDIKLKAHLAICSACKLFEKQTGFIISNAKHAHSNTELDKNVKAKIVESMENS